MEHGEAARVWVVFAVVYHDLPGCLYHDQKCARTGGADHSGIRGKDGGDYGVSAQGLRAGFQGCLL